MKLTRWTVNSYRILMVIMFALFGIGLAALGWITFTWAAVAGLFTLCAFNGYLSILLITSLQRNTPRAMFGRLMSMVLLANMTLTPFSQAIAGEVLRWNILALFAASGGLLLLCALYLTVPRVAFLVSLELMGKP